MKWCSIQSQATYIDIDKEKQAIVVATSFKLKMWECEGIVIILFDESLSLTDTNLRCLDWSTEMLYPFSSPKNSCAYNCGLLLFHMWHTWHYDVMWITCTTTFAWTRILVEVKLAAKVQHDRVVEVNLFAGTPASMSCAELMEITQSGRGYRYEQRHTVIS